MLVKEVDGSGQEDRALEMFDSAADYGSEEFETLGISESLFARVYRKWNSDGAQLWAFDPQEDIVHKRPQGGSFSLRTHHCVLHCTSFSTRRSARFLHLFRSPRRPYHDGRLG